MKNRWELDLHNAVAYDNSVSVRALIQAGAKVNIKNQSGDTPLHLAAIRNHFAIARELILAKANVNAKNNNGHTPLYYAIQHQPQEKELVMQMLIDTGADGKSLLRNAAKDNKIKIMKRLLSAGVSGKSILCEAAQKGDIKVVKTLFAAGVCGGEVLREVARAGDISATRTLLDSEIGRGSLLRDAAKTGDTKVIDSLLRAGANKTILLHQAARRGDVKILIMLLETMDANERNEYKWTPLHVAALNGQSLSVVIALLESGANVDPTVGRKWTPLHFASAFNKTPTVVNVLLKAGANVNAKDCNGQTPLHYASRYGASRNVEALLAAQADISARNDNGWTPLHCAAAFRRRSTVKTLLSAGANGTSLLRVAAHTGEIEVVKGLLGVGAGEYELLLEAAKNGKTNVVATLLRAGMNGKGYLREAARTGEIAIVKVLLKAGMDGESLLNETVNAGDVEIVKGLIRARVDGGKLLREAARIGKMNIAKILLDAGAEIQAKDKTGWTPLHFAAARRKTHAIVEFLLDAGADVDAKNQTKKTPLDVANVPEIKKLLLEHAKTDSRRCEKWRQAHAPKLNNLQHVHEKIAELADPQQFITIEDFIEMKTIAARVVSEFAQPWPSILPEITDMLQNIKILALTDGARKKANEIYIANEKIRSSKLFKSIGKHRLTAEQQRAVVVDGRRNLVVAAAGSGKTLVLVAKAAWLTQRMSYVPEEILLLAFDNNAVEEMESRIRNLIPKFADKIKVSTFHGISMDIIGTSEGKKPSVTKMAEDELKLWDPWIQIVEDLSKSETGESIRSWFQSFFAPYKAEREFETRSEYLHYIQKHHIRSLKGDRVRSYEECEIANWLYFNGVDYEYEKSYKHDLRTPDKSQYKPDFFLPTYDIYIEHFGIDSKGNTASWIKEDAYGEDMRWKQNVHEEHCTTLIETFSYEKTQGVLLENLQKKLAEHGVVFQKIQPDKIFDTLNKKMHILPFAKLLKDFLNHFKMNAQSFSNLAPNDDREKMFLKIFRSFFTKYQNMLAASEEVDFNDMIQKATNYLQTKHYQSPFKYILVDEFQDISPSRACLLKALLQNSDARLFAVGDDWQAIYRFAGADISIMREFKSHFGTMERTDIGTTFRCVDRIAKNATDFILSNSSQIKKTVRTKRKADGVSIHVALAEKPDSPLLEETLRRIAKEAGKQDEMSKVLLLGRYWRMEPENMSALRGRFSQFELLDYKTVHHAKGLEADYVVIRGLCSGEYGQYGFPSEFVDDPLLDLVRPPVLESHPDAEERRLLYVALTRARHHVYLLAEGEHPSRFVKELLDGRYDVEQFGKKPKDPTSCPSCNGGRFDAPKK